MVEKEVQQWRRLARPIVKRKSEKAADVRKKQQRHLQSRARMRKRQVTLHCTHPSPTAKPHDGSNSADSSSSFAKALVSHLTKVIPDRARMPLGEVNASFFFSIHHRRIAEPMCDRYTCVRRRTPPPVTVDARLLQHLTWICKMVRQEDKLDGAAYLQLDLAMETQMNILRCAYVYHNVQRAPERCRNCNYIVLQW